jgi:hypothetical protein
VCVQGGQVAARFIFKSVTSILNPITMILKDRYTASFIYALVAMVLMFYFFRKENKAGIAFFGATAFLPFIYITNRPGRVHHDDGLPTNADISYKPEEGCYWTDIYTKQVDGVKVNNRRFKVSDGADVYIDANLQIYPCGPGSAIMQKVGKAGWEPKSIQDKDCWKLS